MSTLSRLLSAVVRLVGVVGGVCLVVCLIRLRRGRSCANAEFRGGYRRASPTARAWEMVSPVDKANNDVFAAFRSSADGSALAYSSFGGFAGSTTAAFYNSGYVATRTANGWVTTSETPATTAPNPSLATIAESMDFSDDLSTFFTTTAGPYNVNDQNVANDVYMRLPNGTVDWLSTPTPTCPTPSPATPGTRAVLRFEQGRYRVGGAARGRGRAGRVRCMSGAAER